MDRPKLTQAAFLVIICMAISAFTLASAKADDAVYPPNQDAQSFTSSDGGWTNSTTASSLCVSGLTCPTITNSYQASGGAGGAADGYLQTAEGGLLSAGIAATSSGVYESPVFTYQGVSGAAAASAAVKLDILSNLTDFLNVPGASAAYSVMLVDHSGGNNIAAVSQETLDGVPSSWTSFSSSVNPDQLISGHQYSIRISSIFDTSAAFLPAGSVGYDNVSLVASSTYKGTGNNGDNGNNGNGNNTNDNGNNGNSGNGKNGVPAVVTQAGVGINQAVIYRKHLYVRVKCVARKPGNCVTRAWAVTKRKHGKVLSRPSRFRVKSQKSKIVALKLKPVGAKKLSKAKKVLLRERNVIHQVRHKKQIKVVFRRLKLKHVR